MKLAWLCYEIDEYNEDDFITLNPPVIVFQEPDLRRYHKIVPIVYAEIVE